MSDTKKAMNENEHQILVMCWAKKVCLSGRAELDVLFHIPNGGGRSKREAAVLKTMGVKAGVSDLFLPVPMSKRVLVRDGCSESWAWEGVGGLWIELKADKGSVSEEQWKWIYAMRKNGYRAEVCFGWQEAVAVIKDYLGGEWPAEIDAEMVVMEQRLIGGKSDA